MTKRHAEAYPMPIQNYRASNGFKFLFPGLNVNTMKIISYRCIWNSINLYILGLDNTRGQFFKSLALASRTDGKSLALSKVLVLRTRGQGQGRFSDLFVNSIVTEVTVLQKTFRKH
jgi:hypothetical protein